MEGSSIRDRHPDHGAYGEDDRSSRRASPGDDERCVNGRRMYTFMLATSLKRVTEMAFDVIVSAYSDTSASDR